ncbi:MAG: 4'-phosphopantetheinyl transferase superfamily protein [Chloroflexi bacterium]|nr:4'-phosphopantetheinyl transferase superfamily protein [Chloroflexota bacterium]
MSWTGPPASPILTRDAVHLWLVPLDGASYPHARLQPWLAPDEVERAGRYVFQRDREAFILARGFLRLILGTYLGTAPQLLRLAYGTYGKPCLAAGQGAADLTFNLSHSHGLMLLAVALQRQVGVDLEFIRTDFDPQELATHFFAPGECAFLCALPLSRQVEAFFAIWTRKEAYIKARGAGLSIPLDSFEVTPPQGDWGRHLLLKDGAGPLPWELQEVPAEPGHKAALVTEGESCHVSFRYGVAELFSRIVD